MNKLALSEALLVFALTNASTSPLRLKIVALAVTTVHVSRWQYISLRVLILDGTEILHIDDYICRNSRCYASEQMIDLIVKPKLIAAQIPVERVTNLTRLI